MIRICLCDFMLLIGSNSQLPYQNNGIKTNKAFLKWTSNINKHNIPSLPKHGSYY